jgi:uncharacterized protein
VIRVVLDTNTIISGLFWGGLPRQLYIAAIDQRFKPVTSEDMLAELKRVLAYEKFAKALLKRDATPDTVVADYRELCELVTPIDIPPDAVRDPNDRIVLACAVGGQVDYLVSGDKDLLVLEDYEEVPIVTAEE